MEKSKMNRFQYNERIYNYKHGLVNSAENQTIEHSSENEEHIEHALPGTPGSYNYNSNRAKGWEWDDHKYIRKEERADGTIKYIYADGSSRIDDTNKVLGKPMRTAATGGTPGGSYTPPMNKTPNSKPVDANAVNNSSYIPTQTNLNNRMQGTPGGSTYRQPVPGTPTGPLGNGVSASQPRDTFNAKLQMGQGGTPTGLTGTYKNIDPNKVNQANAVLTAQSYKKEADKNAAEKNLYNGQSGTPTGLTGMAKPMSEQAYNLAAGKGTPGGVNGPATPKNAYAADIWSKLKDNVLQGYGEHTTDLANQSNNRMTEIAAENRLNLAQDRREEAEKAGQVSIAEQQVVNPPVPEANSPVFEQAAEMISPDVKVRNEMTTAMNNILNDDNMSYEDKVNAIYNSPYVRNAIDFIYEGVMSDHFDMIPYFVEGPDGKAYLDKYGVVYGNDQEWNDYLDKVNNTVEEFINLSSDEYRDGVSKMLNTDLDRLYRALAAYHRYN